MPGPGTGEVYSFAEGKLYLYASASGTTSGSGVGFAEGASLRFAYGWREARDIDRRYRRQIVERRAELSIQNLLGDLTLFRLANGTAAVNAKFEGLITGGFVRSAQWVLYSGVVDEASFTQQRGQIFGGHYAMHANVWSAFGN